MYRVIQDKFNPKHEIWDQKAYKFQLPNNNMMFGYWEGNSNTVKLGNKELFGHPKIVPNAKSSLLQTLNQSTI